MSDNFISVCHIRKTFGSTVVIDDFSCSIKHNEVVVFIGPSGAGKTTLLRCLNGLEFPDSGEVIVDNIKVSKATVNKVRRKVGMVFQQFNLFPHLTVLQNIVLAQRVVCKRKKQEAKERAIELLKKISLLDKIDSYPAQLSGGQQQRVAIVRALALDPEVMLFDEPTSNLDPEMTKEVLDVMLKLAKTGMTMVIASHEMGFVYQVANWIIFLDKGKIVEEGIPQQIFFSPKNERTKKFMSTLSGVPIKPSY